MLSIVTVEELLEYYDNHLFQKLSSVSVASYLRPSLLVV